MQRHRFVERGQVTAKDVERLAELTEQGILQWHHSDDSCAFSAYPASQKLKDDEQASRAVIGDNLKGARLGYNPATKMWHYLRLTDHGGQYHYVEEGSSADVRNRVDRLYAHATLQMARREGLDVSGLRIA